MALPSHFIGVDGGATRTRARLRDAKGACLAETAGGAANIHVDFAAALAAMRGVVNEVVEKAELGEDDRSRLALGFGLAGLTGDADAERIVEAFIGYALVRAVNDATAACLGAHAGGDGGLVIAGTGSAAIARIGGKETIIGGRGFMLGDDGSGAHMGLKALRAAARAFDRLDPASPLTDEIIARFGGDVLAMLRWAHNAKPGDYGAFAPRVFRHAAAGDPIALNIARKTARGVESHIRGAAALGARRVALVGGIGDAVRPYLDPGVAKLLTAPLYDATDGAILLVGGVLPPLKEPVA